MDGLLLVPPDRGQILGRAVWKSRYVVVGRLPTPRDQVASRSQTSGPSKIIPRASDETQMFTIYKSKGDSEPTQQFPLNAVVDCQVQMVARPRKQGPVLPTLVININDKERKRRSSRAAGLISGKESSAASILYFRTPPDDHHPSLHEWARCIMALKLPVSPESPISPTFTNPFASSRQNTSESLEPRPVSGHRRTSRAVSLQHKSSVNTYSSRERDHYPPVAYNSDSPSLRSKRSDISSPTSTGRPAFVNVPQNYMLPSDLPTPVTPVGEYAGEFIGGWTSAQGRVASATSSPARGRPSLDQRPSLVDSSSPPGPRETILDRAFQMKCIPGAEIMVPGEEKLSSLARFDALMREADDQRKMAEARAKAKRAAVASNALNLDGLGSESGAESVESDSDEEEAEYQLLQNRDRRHQRDTVIPPAAQRALRFIAGQDDRPSSKQEYVSPRSQEFDDGFSSPAPTQNLATFRPQTAHAGKRPSMYQRTQSQPHLTPKAAQKSIPPTSPSAKPEEYASRPSLEKRLSTSSARHMSFTEFTKRLSSTSSLLVVQPNGQSSRTSSSEDLTTPLPRSATAPRAPPSHLKGRELEEWEKRCGWRGSMNMISTEGGFL